MALSSRIKPSAHTSRNPRSPPSVLNINRVDHPLSPHAGQCAPLGGTPNLPGCIGNLFTSVLLIVFAYLYLCATCLFYHTSWERERTRDVRKVEKIVREAMEGVYELKVPLTVDMGVGKNWLEAK